MSLRLHQWIRDLYLFAVDHRSGSLPAALLDRVTQQVPHSASHWQVLDAHGNVVSQCMHDVSGRMPTGNSRGTEDHLPSAGPRVAVFAVNGHDSGQSHRFTFRRDEAVSPFDVDERAALERIVEHLTGADMLGRRIAQHAASSNADRGGVGIALVDRSGRLNAIDAEFVRLLREVVPDWNGTRLPFEIQEPIDPTRPGFVFKGLWVAIQPQPSGHELRIRPDRRAIKLSDRELEIAERVAEGFTFREIGMEIGVAPSTVSTHLYNLYAKLGIRRRAELVAWLKHHRRED
jgi:DNA-binding CsgD family transcriptional regulator